MRSLLKIFIVVSLTVFSFNAYSVTPYWCGYQSLYKEYPTDACKKADYWNIKGKLLNKSAEQCRILGMDTIKDTLKRTATLCQKLSNNNGIVNVFMARAKCNLYYSSLFKDPWIEPTTAELTTEISKYEDCATP